jgi:hypothetical protein
MLASVAFISVAASSVIILTIGTSERRNLVFNVYELCLGFVVFVVVSVTAIVWPER